MPVVEESVVIDLPRSEVFASTLNPENILIWSSNILDYEVIAQSPGQEGAKVRVKMKVAGKIIVGTGEAVEVEDGRRIKSRVVDSPIPFENETRFEDTNGGTRVTQRQEFQIPEGFFGELDDPLVVELYATDLRSNFEKLKVLLEAQDA